MLFFCGKKLTSGKDNMFSLTLRVQCWYQESEGHRKKEFEFHLCICNQSWKAERVLSLCYIVKKPTNNVPHISKRIFYYSEHIQKLF